MLCVVYSSVAEPSVGEEEVAQIIEEAEARNSRLGITGALVFDGRRFCQLLEGGRDDVTQLMEKIIRDRRHTKVDVLGSTAVTDRRFPGWAMLRVESEEFVKMLDGLAVTQIPD